MNQERTIQTRQKEKEKSEEENGECGKEEAERRRKMREVKGR
jgi:hypothetical protein